MKQPITLGACILFAVACVLLAGCGSHDQNAPAADGSQGTPPSITQQAKQNTQEIQNHPPPTAAVPPTNK